MLRKQVTRPGRSQETRSTKSLVTGPIRVFVPHRLGGQVPKTHLAALGESVERGEVRMDLHDVGERGAVGLQDRSEVLEDLFGLGRQLVGSDQGALGIVRDLTGDVDPGSVGRVDSNGVRVGADGTSDDIGVRRVVCMRPPIYPAAGSRRISATRAGCSRAAKWPVSGRVIHSAPANTSRLASRSGARDQS
jgi:hypothetical protein